MQCGPMPTAQFASISLLMDDSEIDIDSLVQLTTVFSPLSEITPMAVKNALGELHCKIQKDISFEDKSRINDGLNANGTASTVRAKHDQLQDEIHKDLGDQQSVDEKSAFERLCERETYEYEKRLKEKKKSNFATFRTSEGLDIEYTLITEPTLTERIISTFQLGPVSLPYHCLVFSCGVSGSSMSKILSLDMPGFRKRMNQFVQLLPRSVLCTDRNVQATQKEDIEIRLLSVLMNDEFLIGNEEFDNDGIDDIINADWNEKSSKKLGKPKLFPKKLLKRRKRKQVDEVDEVSKAITSTALISSSATSSEIGRIISDQMQVLAISKASMEFEGYKHGWRSNTSSKTDRSSGIMKSPTRVSRKLGRDLIGFDYVPKQANSEESSAFDNASVSGGMSYVSDMTSVTGSTVVTESSSSSSIPTLSGSSRDSVSIKRYSRKNKLIPPKYGSLPSPSKKNTLQNGFDPFDSNQNQQVFNDSIPKMPNYSSPNGKSNKKRGESSTYTPPRSPYIPGSRKIFTTMALNEDLVCTYKGSRMTSCIVQGIVQILMNSDSTAFVPFAVRVFDDDDHISSIEANKQFLNDVSKEKEPGEEDWEHKYIVTLPKADNYYPILRYDCGDKLIPVPLVRIQLNVRLFIQLQHISKTIIIYLQRVQSKVRTNGVVCRVALQISSNPSNEKPLTELTITLSVPESVIGESVITQPEGGIWIAKKRHVVWCVKELGSGEKFVLQAQFQLKKGTLENGDSPAFSTMVQCQSMSAQLSNVSLDCCDAKGFPGEVNVKIARRFRISQRELEG